MKHRPDELCQWSGVLSMISCYVAKYLLLEPYRFKKGTVERGNLWTAIADNLNNVEEVKFRVKQRSVRERYDLLISRFRNKIQQEERETGTSPPELTEVESLREDITDRENLASSHLKQSHKVKVDTERKAAEEIRKRAMEAMSNGRKENYSGDPPKKRVRRNGSEALELLREKYEIESRLREQELQQEKQQKANEAQTNPQLHQQQMFRAMMQQSQNMQQALLKQQEQQNIALMAILGKLASD